jgi:hypothetical protein
MDKLKIISNTWQLAEDQIRNIEHFVLQAPFDQVDRAYLLKFADVRKQLAELRVGYLEEKEKLMNGQEREASASEPEYEFGAPRFPGDDL